MRVDLPEPVPPRIPNVEPAGIVREMFFRTGEGAFAYAYVTFSNVISRSIGGSPASFESVSISEFMM